MLAKELLREGFTANGVDHAHRRLIVFFQWCAEAGVPELYRLAPPTIDRWTDELLAFHTTGGASNGPAEAVNLLIENARRAGYGFRNFNNYRLRLLLACGIKWQTPPVARTEAVNHAPQRRAAIGDHRIVDRLPVRTELTGDVGHRPPGPTAFRGGQPVGAAALVEVGLFHPVPQTAVGDAQVLAISGSSELSGV